MRKINWLILLCVPVFCFSQNSEKTKPFITINGNVGIPRSVSSKMFRTSFAGIFEANLCVNLYLFDNFHAGVGYQSDFFQNNAILRAKLFNASIPYSTKLLGNSAFIRLGYDNYFSEKGYFGYSINGGYMLVDYLEVNNDTSKANRPFVGKRLSAPFFQPEISANFIVDSRLSFSLMLSYTTLFYRFDPKAPRFNQFQEVQSAANKYVMSWINIGAGFTVLIKNKK
jgi:hypothetical protein